MTDPPTLSPRSVRAQSALDRAGELLSGQPATVLTVGEPFVDVMTRTTTGMGIGASPLKREQPRPRRVN